MEVLKIVKESEATLSGVDVTASSIDSISKISEITGISGISVPSNMLALISTNAAGILNEAKRVLRVKFPSLLKKREKVEKNEAENLSNIQKNENVDKGR